jgi:hypothetical protein
VWRVLDFRGDVARRILAPAGFSILDARGDRGWGTSTDSLGVTYVERYPVLCRPNVRYRVLCRPNVSGRARR